MIVALGHLVVRGLPAGELKQVLRSEWAGLAEDNFMVQPAWLEAAWEMKHAGERGVGPSGWAAMGAFSPSGRLTGVAPMYLRRQSGLRVLRMLGTGTICSDYVEFPSLPDHALETAEQFAGAVAKGVPGAGGTRRGVDVVEIEGHRLGCPRWETFFATLAEAGWSRSGSEIEGAWRVELPESWEIYEQQLHRSRRRKARKAIKMLKRGEVSHEVVADPAEIGRLWPEFVDLHQQRRRLLGQAGCFSEREFGGFLQQATLEMASQGRAWLSVVSHEGSRLAMLLMFESGQTGFMYQSGLDVAKLRLEPGHLVNALTIREAIRRGIQGFDWLRGDEPYKQGWGARRIPLGRTRLFAPGLRGRGALALNALKSLLRSRRAGAATAAPGEEADDDGQD